MFEEYKRQVLKLNTLNALDAFFEFIAYAEDITPEEYCELYNVGLRMAQEWRGF